ncbi:MAG: hypothetical protein U0401_10380 [Anaerolineae bacterium]
MARQSDSIEMAWHKGNHLRPASAAAYDCCQELRCNSTLTAGGYRNQSLLGSTGWSDGNCRSSSIRAVEIYRPEEAQPLATHARCYEQEKDICRSVTCC